MAFSVRDPDYEARVRSSFAAQKFMATIGAQMERVVPGEVRLVLPFREDLVQQHGSLHAGVTAALADSACGYAALTLMDPGTAVVSIEFKVNLLEPARGDGFIATGRVVRAGRTLTVCSAEVVANRASSAVAVAIMQATMMTLRDRPGLHD